jgi:hypothetical protein
MSRKCTEPPEISTIGPIRRSFSEIFQKHDDRTWIQNKYNVPPSTEAFAYVVFKGYRVVWQLQWTARRQIECKLITPGKGSVECRAERWRSLYADMDVGRLKYGGWLKNSTLCRYYPVGQKQRGRTSTVLETAALQSMLDHHITASTYGTT